MKSFKKALTNIRRTPYQSISAIMVLVQTFFIAIAIAFISAGLFQALRYFETRPQVIIFFSSDAPESQIEDLKTELENSSQIAEIKYTPQEEALEIYSQLNQNDPLLLELVTADILPASLEVSTQSLSALNTIVEMSQNAPGVEEVKLPAEAINALQKWLNGLQIAGGIFITFMAVTSLLIITIVVGMKISAKNYEIRVLKLIGASNWYIKGPYLLEGAFYGILSSTIAFILAMTALLYSTPIILEFAGEVPLLPDSPLILLCIFAGALVSGMVIGTIGSWIAVKRYLSKS